jgi:hypothetical protein
MSDGPDETDAPFAAHRGEKEKTQLGGEKSLWHSLLLVMAEEKSAEMPAKGGPIDGGFCV